MVAVMALEPTPPPVGKPSLPFKHQCGQVTHCCDIPISQIGCHYHFVPRIFIDMVLFPPSVMDQPVLPRPYQGVLRGA